jgi:hypothetical protein
MHHEVAVVEVERDLQPSRSIAFLSVAGMSRFSVSPNS